MSYFTQRSQAGRCFAGAAALAVLVSQLTPDPNHAEYSNLLLVPELAEDLELDLATRIHFAHLGSSLLDAIAGSVDADEQIAHYGMSVTEWLSDEQNTAFARRVRAGEIIPVALQSGALAFGWRTAESSAAQRTLSQTRTVLDSAHEWIASEHVALELLGNNSDAVNGAAARWLNLNSTRYRGVTSRARRQFLEKSAAMGGLGP